MTTQDQLNLITLVDLAKAGNANLPYAEKDIFAISEAANQHKIEQISRFNTLKSYVETLTDLNEIAAVTYETEI